MSIQIPTAYVEQFSSNVTFLYQEGDFALNGATRVETVNGKTAWFDQIGKTTMQKRTTRHAPTVLSDIRQDRRKLVTDPYDGGSMIDEPDQVRLLADLKGPFAENFRMAMNRTMTSVILTAAIGTAYAKKNGATSESAVTLPTGASATSQTIAVNYVKGQARGAGTGSNTNMILDKLTEAKYLLDIEDTPMGDPRFIALTASQTKAMLDNITEIKSSDYANVKALVDGEVDYFMGFRFIRSNEVYVNASDVASVVAWSKNALLLGKAAAPTVRVDERPDLSYGIQVFATMDIGATRMQEEGVIEIKCDQSP